mgnify:CR=1 FL=1
MKIHFVDQQWLGEKTKQIEKSVFEQAGMEIEFHDWSTEDEIIAGGQDADAIMVVAVPMSRKTIEALPKLKFIGRCGIGYDSVDLQAATERGIPVCNVPDYCTYEVATQSFLFALALKKHLLGFLDRGKTGAYGQGTELIVHRLTGQKFGQIGFGRIAREQAKMVRGFGMEMLVYDPYLKEIKEEGIRLCKTLQEVLENADIVSINTILNEETYHMIGMNELKMMKPDAVLVNVSRGAIVNTEDLLTALEQKIIAGAGLDVIEGEPLPADHPAHKLKNLLYTPHISMYSEEAMIELHIKLTAQALDILSGRWTSNVVNPLVKDRGNWK